MSNKVIGGIQLLVASFIFSLFGFFYRNISEFGTFSQGMMRGFFILFFSLIFLYFTKEKLKVFSKKDLHWVILWMIPSSIQPILIFLAFNNLPIGLVYFLFYAGMLLSSFILGRYIFNEKINGIKGISLILTIIGIVIIYSTNLQFISNIYILLSLIAGVLTGMWNVFTKKISSNYSTHQMIITDSFIIFLSGLIFTFIFNEPVNFAVSGSSWLWIIGFALLNIVGNILAIKGFSKVEAQIGSLIMPTQIFFGAILSYLFLKESLNIEIYFGGFFVLLAAILPYLRKN